MRMRIKKVGSGQIGFIDYNIHDVRGDGHCFYRSIYQILSESTVGQEMLDIKETYTNPGKTEDDGVEIIRSYIAKGIRQGLFEDARNTIDNLCSLTDGLSESDKEELFENLEEMYPFVNTETCELRGIRRYVAIANMIESMDKPVMYASSLEIDIIKGELATKGENGANLSILVISNTGKRSKQVEERWKNDLLGLLQNAVTRNVAVLLNKDNLHYQYLMFKGPSDTEYHAIVNRRKMADLLASSSYTSALEIGIQTLTLNTPGSSSPVKAEVQTEVRAETQASIEPEQKKRSTSRKSTKKNSTQAQPLAQLDIINEEEKKTVRVSRKSKTAKISNADKSRLIGFIGGGKNGENKMPLQKRKQMMYSVQ